MTPHPGPQPAGSDRQRGNPNGRRPTPVPDPRHLLLRQPRRNAGHEQRNHRLGLSGPPVQQGQTIPRPRRRQSRRSILRRYLARGHRQDAPTPGAGRHPPSFVPLHQLHRGHRVAVRQMVSDIHGGAPRRNSQNNETRRQPVPALRPHRQLPATRTARRRLRTPKLSQRNSLVLYGTWKNHSLVSPQTRYYPVLRQGYQAKSRF